MGLKFFSQRKHLARLVLGFVAVWNSWQTGQRNRKNPSLNFDGSLRCFSINVSIGMWFRNTNNSWDEKCRFICTPLQKFSKYYLDLWLRQRKTHYRGGKPPTILPYAPQKLQRGLVFCTMGYKITRKGGVFVDSSAMVFFVLPIRRILSLRQWASRPLSEVRYRLWALRCDLNWASLRHLLEQ